MSKKATPGDGTHGKGSERRSSVGCSPVTPTELSGHVDIADLSQALTATIEDVLQGVDTAAVASLYGDRDVKGPGWVVECFGSLSGKEWSAGAVDVNVG